MVLWSVDCSKDGFGGHLLNNAHPTAISSGPSSKLTKYSSNKSELNLVNRYIKTKIGINNKVLKNLTKGQHQNLECPNCPILFANKTIKN